MDELATKINRTVLHEFKIELFVREEKLIYTDYRYDMIQKDSFILIMQLTVLFSVCIIVSIAIQLVLIDRFIRHQTCYSQVFSPIVSI